tara:strand:- start:2853 stop:3635 length:783 start_codon:yes stop_codon:yes gene_type:complete
MKYDPNINEDMIRHLILNTYRMYRNKFHEEYGELVICHDGGRYWRKDIFPEYKANRSKSQKNSDVDWDRVHDVMNMIYDEILDNLPYKNLKIRTVEADDIIAVLCERYHEKEKIVIVSNDKDFQQLQRFPNVRQFSPIKKQFLDCDNPEDFLIHHILKGDSSDGIPNILSDNDSFVNEDKRQKPCGEKRISIMKENLSEWTSTENWNRNQSLIDMSKIPEKIQQAVLDEFNKEPKADRSKILNYFIDKKLKNLMVNIEEF